MRRLQTITLPKTTHTLPFPYKNNQTLFLPSSSSKKPKPRWAHMAAPTQKKVVVIMGPTGCGKSKLSVDLASRFFPSSEIINSDKIQVHRGLDITTNKIPLPERKNVPHHLLGEFDSSESHPEFTPSDFRTGASVLISKMGSRRKLPLIVGGSNSFVYALLAKRYDPELDVFDSDDDSVFCRELRYRCCFIWVDVAPPVLNEYLDKRVDDMLDSGMFEELEEFFAESDSVSQCGLGRAIGVPEFERYFRSFSNKNENNINNDDVEKRRVMYEEAVRAIKDNTCLLAKRQMGKILRLRDAAGWDLKRVDATWAVRAAMMGGRRRAAGIWERQVLEPSVNIVNRFLME